VINFYKFFFLFSFILVLANLKVKSDINLPDTSFSKGSKHFYPIYSNSDFKDINNLYVKLIFDANLLEIHNIIFNDTTLASNSSSKFNKYININDLKNSTLTIEATEFNSNNLSSILFFLEIEALSGYDSVAFINIDSVLINNNLYSGNISEGRISIGRPIIQKYVDNLGNCFPNPFSDFTNINFSIGSLTPLNMNIYNSSGKLITNLFEENSYFEIEILDQNKNIYSEELFKQGTYNMQLKPKKYSVSSGAYFIIMETNSGVLQTNLIFAY